jgi:uncharacterized protein (TIGR03083 family)
VREPLTASPDDLRRAAARTAQLLRSIPDPDAPVRGLEWNVGQTAAHLVTEMRTYAQLAAGSVTARRILDQLTLPPEPLPGQINAAANAWALQRETERSPGRLAEQLEAATEQFIEAAMFLTPDHDVPVTNGTTMTPSVMTATLLGEQLIHGLDIARAQSTPWPVSHADALLVLAGTLTQAPAYLNHRAARFLDRTYEIRFRSGPCYHFTIRRGAAAVTAATPDTLPECVITADPVAFLLLGYGRSSRIAPILRGQMTASGRRPWLAARFARLLTPV